MIVDTSIHVRLENVFVVVLMDIHFLHVHDLQRASLAVSLSNRLKVKDVRHLPRLRQSLHRVLSLRHSLRRLVPKEEVKARTIDLPINLLPSLPPSLPRSPLKAGEVSFDDDDAEEEDPDAEYDWVEEEEEHVETVADHAFATPYHSHVCAVHERHDGERDPMNSMVVPGQPQLEDLSEEQWTTDEDAIDTPGLTPTPNSPVTQQRSLPRRVPSEQARNVAAAVMRTNFPKLLAEMNPDWAGLTAQDLIHSSDDSSESMELEDSEEEPMEQEHDSDSEERDGFPNIQLPSTSDRGR